MVSVKPRCKKGELGVMKYPLATTTWDEREYEAIRRVVSTGKFTMGLEVAKFEDQFARKLGVEHAVMSNSGSSANLLAVSAIKYSSFRPAEGRNEVIVPAVSWVPPTTLLHRWAIG